MSDSSLIIYDEYITDMAEHFGRQGETLEKMFGEYVEALKEIKASGIQEGETADILDCFIAHAALLRTKLESIGQLAQETTNEFLTVVDEKDQYLF